MVIAGAADKPSIRSAIGDEPYGSVPVFRDPDDIRLGSFCSPRT